LPRIQAEIARLVLQKSTIIAGKAFKGAAKIACGQPVVAARLQAISGSSRAGADFRF
jgi:hypothetical protein